MRISSAPNLNFKAVLLDSTIVNLSENDKVALLKVKRELDKYKRVDVTIGANKQRDIRLNYKPASPINMYIDSDVFEPQERDFQLGLIWNLLHRVAKENRGTKEPTLDLYANLNTDETQDIIQNAKYLAEIFIEKFCKNDLN